MSCNLRVDSAEDKEMQGTFQRNMQGFDLMDYKTRLRFVLPRSYCEEGFYDPTTGSFIQPDILGSGNRYSYTMDNPINNNDPSGYTACAEGDYACANEGGFEKRDYLHMLKYGFGWDVDSNFTIDQIRTIYDAASQIKTGVDSHSGGEGDSWMWKNLSNVNLHRGGIPALIVSIFNKGQSTSVTFPVEDVWLTFDFLTAPNAIEYVIHEVAHVLDNNKGPSVCEGGPSTWSGAGPSDTLTKYLGGNPTGYRWDNKTNGIDEKYYWKDLWITNNGYGNHSSADYFAESFAWAIVDPSKIPSANVLDWIISFINPSNGFQLNNPSNGSRNSAKLQ